MDEHATMINFEEKRGAFGESLSPHFPQDATDDAFSLDNCSLPYKQISWFGTTPISGLGMMLNIVVILVWNVKAKSQPIVYFFKALAAMDLTYILSFNLWWYSPRDYTFGQLMAFIMTSSQFSLVNVTLLICTWRWISVFKVERNRKMLSMYRAKMAVGIVMTYCIVLNVVQELVIIGISDRKLVITILTVVFSNLLLSVPLILAALLSIHLALTLTKSINDKVSPEMSSTGHLHFQSHSRHAKAKLQRLTKCITSVSVTTFIAYPLSGAMIAFYKLSFRQEDNCAQQLAFGITYLLYVINSSINFFFYFFFMLKFRKMFLLKFITLYLGANYSTRMGSETEAPSETGMHSTLLESPRSLHHHDQGYRHSIVVIAEDGILTISKAMPSASEGRDSINFMPSGSGRKKSVNIPP